MTTAAPAGPATLFGLPLDALAMADVVALARHAVATDERLLIGVVNAAKVVHARHDTVLRESLLQADVVLADGQAVVWASRLVGRPLPERVAGIDLFTELLDVAEQDGRSVFLLGATPAVLQQVVDRVHADHPTLRIAGARDGYFTEDEAGAVAAEIGRSGADMLFLGINSPKKENFLAAHCDTLGVPVLHGVGGSFDVLAGVTKRAPERWQRAGLEWLYRLVQEPRRMWRRYLVTNTAFIVLTLRELVTPTAPYPCGHARQQRNPQVRVSDLAKVSLARAGVSADALPAVADAVEALHAASPVPTRSPRAPGRA